MEEDNPFREDNAGLDEVLIGFGDSNESSGDGDDSVQKMLQQAEDSISNTMHADPDLLFQPSSAPQITTGGSIASNDRSSLLGNSSYSRSRSGNESVNGAESRQATGYIARCCSCISIDYYKPYFDVDTIHVTERLKRVFMPWKDDFFQQVDAHPDLYSPFWICTTLILFTSVSSGLARYFSSDGTKELTYKSDVATLSVATTFVYGFAVAMPAAAYFVLSRLEIGGKLDVVELICVYGYSLAAFIPAIFGCIIPVNGLDWAFVMAGFGCSAMFLLRNLWVRLQAQGASMDEISADTSTGEGRKKIATLLVGLVGLHLAFTVGLKYLFF